MRGSFEVSSVRHPLSMLTTSRVSLPLAAAPRISLQCVHRWALSLLALIAVTRSAWRATAACTARTRADDSAE